MRRLEQTETIYAYGDLRAVLGQLLDDVAWKLTHTIWEHAGEVVSETEDCRRVNIPVQLP